MISRERERERYIRCRFFAFYLWFFVMASLRDLVDALVCDYLIKQDPHLGKTFKKKTLAVCEDTRIMYFFSNVV